MGSGFYCLQVRTTELDSWGCSPGPAVISASLATITMCPPQASGTFGEEQMMGCAGEGS